VAVAAHRAADRLGAGRGFCGEGDEQCCEAKHAFFSEGPFDLLRLNSTLTRESVNAAAILKVL